MATDDPDKTWLVSIQRRDFPALYAIFDNIEASSAESAIQQARLLAGEDAKNLDWSNVATAGPEDV